MLELFVQEVLKEVGAPKGMRLGENEASVNVFMSRASTARRGSGGALTVHHDYSISQVAYDKHSYNIIMLLADVGEHDGPTYVFPGSRVEREDQNIKRRLEGPSSLYTRERLIGACGDVFVFHAADFHGVEAIVRMRGEEVDDTWRRANLVLGGQHAVLDRLIQNEEK